MKARPIGPIVAHSDSCDLRLLIDVMRPEDGSATTLREDLNSLSEGQLLKLKDILQGDLDNICKKLVCTIQEMLAQNASEPEQTELEFDPPDEDELEIPAFMRRHST